jgi:hypothetical protein
VDPAEIIEVFSEDIEAGGFNVAALVADQTGCDWAYSVGLHKIHDHPELLIVGLDATIGGAVIELLGREVAEGRRLEQGSTVVLMDRFELQVREVDPLWLGRGDWFDLGRAVMEHWGERWPPTLQLIWPDADGEYPLRPGDPRWSLRQPLLVAA